MSNDSADPPDGGDQIEVDLPDSGRVNRVGSGVWFARLPPTANRTTAIPIAVNPQAAAKETILTSDAKSGMRPKSKNM